MESYIMDEMSDENRIDMLKRGRKELERAEEAVKPILEKVRVEGDRALLEYTRKLDRAEIASVQVGGGELEEAFDKVNPELVEALRRASKNIAGFHRRQLAEGFMYSKGGRELGMLVRPMQRVGCYVPGGRASYPSTVLMCAIPARVAGVEQVAVSTPPMEDGRVNPLTLVACSIAKVDKVYMVGGAQAVAALAYGTESIGKVDKIVGPGNVYVTAAKRLVASEVAIDMPAGPSELLVIADERARAEHLTRDLLAQAEHDPDATCILLTTSQNLAKRVQEYLGAEKLENEVARASFEKNGAVILVSSMEQAVRFANDFAPEHLQIVTNMDDEIIKKIHSAGSIFAGEYTPVASGDYASGTNHVLPTSGYARAYSGLRTSSFLKYVPWQRLSREALKELSEVIIPLAEAEGLKAHADSVRVRLEEKDDRA